MTSRFIGKAAAALAPYAPGEQPQDKKYIKLNTNESPYPPAPGVSQVLREYDAGELRLYPDPDVRLLQRSMAECYGLQPEEVFVGGGSDEILGFAFMAFFDPGDKVYFPDITYGFYSVYAQLCGVEAVRIPLREDFTLAPEDYYGLDGHIVFANPNAPTGMAITPAQVEEILKRNPDRLVIVDEAYIDFSEDKTCVPMIEKYDNLLITQTYSKSRGLAGMRIGCGLGQAELIADLNRMKYSFNPYNLDRLSIVIGVAATEDKAWLAETTGNIVKTRNRAMSDLEAMGFEVLPSESNFIFARTPKMGGFDLYKGLKDRGVLVRQFEKDRIRDFIRITVGSPEEMAVLMRTLEELL